MTRVRRKSDPIHTVIIESRHQLTDGVWRLKADDLQHLWTRINVRKAKPCWSCGRLIIVGVVCYSPLSNEGNRYRRFCSTCVEST